MIIEISVAVIAVAFVFLAIYLIVTALSVRRTLVEVDKTLVELRKQLNDNGEGVKKIIENAADLSSNLQYKMESLDSVFNTVANVGDILELKTEAVKESILDSTIFEEESRHHPQNFKIADILELAGLSFRLWQKLKKRR